jgi:hypothetical protein
MMTAKSGDLIVELVFRDTQAQAGVEDTHSLTERTGPRHIAHRSGE